jgi:hypothetical protein
MKLAGLASRSWRRFVKLMTGAIRLLNQAMKVVVTAISLTDRSKNLVR